MRTVAALALAAATALSVGGYSGGSILGKPSLRLVDVQPLIVRGSGFAARERVRVSLSGVTEATQRVSANGVGVFTVTFAEVTATRCDLIRVVAVGRGGHRAYLKRLPSPACHTGSEPSLLLLDLQPLVVRGSGFAAREHVRVNLSGVTEATQRVSANGVGVFTVTFAEVTATRCDLIRVVAIGEGGRRAQLKRLPSPACHPG